MSTAFAGWRVVVSAGPTFEDIDPARWHDYRLILRADRWAELYIDGRRIAAAPPLDDIDEHAPVRILLGRRSLDTRLVHDDVRLYEGWRVLPNDR